MVVTDIMNPGTYEIKNRQVIFTLSSTGDAPRVMVFSFVDDDTTLRLESDGTLWTLRKP
jgi:hypothetical protein